jgi:hypothetical protein
MILVDETTKFIEDHVETNWVDPFLACVALGSVNVPHSPPDRYLGGDKIAGVYPTKHMDVLLEMDKVVGSLISLREENPENTIIIFARVTMGDWGVGKECGAFLKW